MLKFWLLLSVLLNCAAIAQNIGDGKVSFKTGISAGLAVVCALALAREDR